ncbi:MAG: hypothetical protein ONB52_21885 [candidate division KSB1 bacterium]|nr:hypothetical protein [candidate division KSB1 bacterium]
MTDVEKTDQEPVVDSQGPAEEQLAAATGDVSTQEGAATQVPPEAETAESEESAYVVRIPGMPERGEPEVIEFEVEDEQSYNILNRLQNLAEIGRQYRERERALERKAEQLAEVEDLIASDPLGFVVERLSPQLKTDVAVSVLLEDGGLEQLDRRIQEILTRAGYDSAGGLQEVLADPHALRLLRSELRATRLQIREQLQALAEERRAQRAIAQKVADQVDELVPRDVGDLDRDVVVAKVTAYVRDRVARLGLQRLEPEDVALLVQQQLRDLGVRAAKQAGTRSPKPEDLLKAQSEKRKAAAAAPAGAGAPVGPSPKAPKTTEEAIHLARKQGLRGLLGLR